MSKKKNRENSNVNKEEANTPESDILKEYDKFSQGPDAIDMLEKEPAWGTRGLIFIILGLVVAGLIWSTIAKFSETVAAPGKLTVEGESVPVQISQDGYVKEILVEEGEAVKEGDPLLIYSKQKVEAKEDILAEISKAEDTLKAKQYALGIRERQLVSAKENLNRSEEQYQIYKSMFDKGLLAKVDFLKVYNILDEANRNVGNIKTDIKNYEADIAELKRNLERLHIALQPYDLPQYQDDEIDIKKLPKTEDVILAPQSGIISKSHIKHEGSLIKQGSTVFSILPQGQPLIALINIPNSGIGKIKVDMPVNMKFDAFPYKEYGFGEGTLFWLAPDATVDEQGAAVSFEGKVKLKKNYLTKRGKRYEFRPGMSLEADIVVEKKRVIFMFYDFIRGITR